MDQCEDCNKQLDFLLKLFFYNNNIQWQDADQIADRPLNVDLASVRAFHVEAAVVVTRGVVPIVQISKIKCIVMRVPDVGGMVQNVIKEKRIVSK